MKRLSILVAILTAGSCLFGQQVVLTQKTHGLAPYHINAMKMADFVEPGNGGKNQVWDLSEMERSKDFTGFVAPSGDVDSNLHFSHANVVLNEEGNQFFFCQEEDVLTAWGTMNRVGQVRMKYNRPFIKMKYPFTYGDEFSGEYDGTYYLATREVPLAGTYSVKADGAGRLILPGNIEIKNALRVVSTRSYDVMLEKGTQTYEIITYRWYSNTERFPLAVLLVQRSTVCNPDGSYSYSGFCRIPEEPEKLAEEQPEEPSKLATGIEQDLIRIFPNPVKHEFRMEFIVSTDSKVNIELFDNSGRKIAVLKDQFMQAGTHSESFSTKKYAMEHGIYHIRGLIGDQVSRTTFIRE